MRTTQRSTRARLVPAGLLTVGAVVAALLVAPQAALAAGTVSPTAGPIGTSVTLTSSAAITTAPGVEMRADQACTGTTYTTPTTAIIAATGVTKSTDNLSLTFSVPTLPLGTAGVPKSYNICVYATATTGAALVTAADGATFNLVPAATPTASTGASGGGNTITVNVPSTAAVLGSGPYGVAFTNSTSGCTAAMPSTTNNPLTSTATKAGTAGTQVTIPVPVGVGGGPTATQFEICIYSGTTTAGTLVAASSTTAYGVTAATSTPNSTIGAGGDSSTPVNLTLSSTTNNFLNGVTTTPYVVLYPTATACPGTYPSSPTANTFGAARKLANNKAAFTLPSAITTTSSTSTVYNVCLYSTNSNTTGRLLTATTYTVANVPTLVSVSPASGSALGGATITITGTNFPQTAGSITATLGGVALTQITPIDSTSFTAMTPAHATGKVALTISTAVGSDTMANAFEYKNSIQVTPNTAPNTSASTDLDVQGTGFFNLSFGTSASDSHVYLVNGVYNPATGTGNSAKQNGAVAECASVLVFSDNELACTMNLTVAMNAAGTLTPNGYRTASDAVTTLSSNIVTSATAAFTQADVGKDLTPTVDNTKIAANTTILAVLSPTQAVMSNTSVAAGTAIAVSIGYTRTAVAVTAASGNTVTGASGAFLQADVGRYVTGTGVPANTVVLSVNDTGTTATLSNATTVSAPSTVDLSSGNPVPNGAYNITVVSTGSTNAATAVNPTIPWSQTVVSSGSTFTVAPF